MIGAVLEAPLAVEPSLEYKPFLVEKTPSYDAGTLGLEPLTVEVRLREGVTFSDGKPLTSADVKWTYEQAIKLARNGEIAPLYDGFGRVSQIETPDERNVRLVFEKPYAFWRDLLTAPILPRHVYEGKGFVGLRLNRQPVGSGPFSLEGPTGTRIELAENRNYWTGEPLPNLEGVEITALSPGKSAEALSEGKADFGFFATPRTFPDSGELLRASAAPVRVETLLFNSGNLDGATRASVVRAVGRERIAAVAGGQVAQSFIPPKFVPGYTPAWENQDPTEPRKENSTGSTLELVYQEEPQGQVRDGVVKDLAAELSGAGIEVKPRAVTSAKFFGEVLPDGNFDLALFTLGSPAGYEALLPGLTSKSRGKLARSLKILDTQDRTHALRAAQQRMAEEAAILPLFVWPDTMAWSSIITGPRPDVPYRGLMSNVREWAFYK